MNIELTIDDIKVMKEIISLALSRGAIKPEETVAVGQLYNTITTFVNSHVQGEKQ